MKIVIKSVKYLFIFLLSIVFLLLLAFFVLYLIYNKAKPTLIGGDAALGKKVELYDAVHKTAWDSTNYVQWTFNKNNQYLWDLKNHLFALRNTDKTIVMNPSTRLAFTIENNNSRPATEKEKDNAYTRFTNDAFWLNGYMQLENRDILLETTENEQKDLMVTYLSGGVTPGDGYWWHLDATGLPESCSMWLKMFPIGGMTVTFQDWEETSTGLKYAQNHYLGSFNLVRIKAQSFQLLKDSDFDTSVFETLM